MTHPVSFTKNKHTVFFYRIELKKITAHVRLSRDIFWLKEGNVPKHKIWPQVSKIPCNQYHTQVTEPQTSGWKMRTTCIRKPDILKYPVQQKTYLSTTVANHSNSATASWRLCFKESERDHVSFKREEFSLCIVVNGLVLLFPFSGCFGFLAEMILEHSLDKDIC